MRRFSGFARLTVLLLVIAAMLASPAPAAAQTLRDLNQTLDRIEPSVSQGVGNPDAASEGERARIISPFQDEPRLGRLWRIHCEIWTVLLSRGLHNAVGRAGSCD